MGSVTEFLFHWKMTLKFSGVILDIFRSPQLLKDETFHKISLLSLSSLCCELSVKPWFAFRWHSPCCALSYEDKKCPSYNDEKSDISLSLLQYRHKVRYVPLVYIVPSGSQGSLMSEVLVILHVVAIWCRCENNSPLFETWLSSSKEIFRVIAKSFVLAVEN